MVVKPWSDCEIYCYTQYGRALEDQHEVIRSLPLIPSTVTWRRLWGFQAWYLPPGWVLPLGAVSPCEVVMPDSGLRYPYRQILAEFGDDNGL